MKTKFMLLVCVSSLLVACNEKLTYEYLVQHPQVLKREADQCQSGTTNDPARCRMVMNAKMNFDAMYNDRQVHPEQFGERLLSLQTELVKLKTEMQAAQAKLTTAKASANPADIQAAQADFAKAEMLYVAQRNEIRMMLAVIGVDSPE